MKEINPTATGPKTKHQRQILAWTPPCYSKSIKAVYSISYKRINVYGPIRNTPIGLDTFTAARHTVEYDIKVGKTLKEKITTCNGRPDGVETCSALKTKYYFTVTYSYV
jgi:hypothetical protein